MVTKSARQRDTVFRALADPTRRQILNILRSGNQTVGSIAGNFRMSRPAISKHSVCCIVPAWSTLVHKEPRTCAA
jgi:DNA-binding transcriptional ArsR family regulator